MPYSRGKGECQMPGGDVEVTNWLVHNGLLQFLRVSLSFLLNGEWCHLIITSCALFINLLPTLSFRSDLLLEATEYLLLPKRKSQVQSQNRRVAPRRPTSVNQVLYAIGGMSRREASKSGEKYDPREGRWKAIGEESINCVPAFWVDISGQCIESNRMP